MSCKKDAPKKKAKPGRFQCKDCGAVAKKKSKICDPKKVRQKKQRP